MLLGLAVCACGDGTRPAATVRMLDPVNAVHGKTYPQWAVEYMKWRFETPFSVLADVKDCGAGQDPAQPVAFLAEDLAARTEPLPCAFASERSLLVPLFPLSVDSATAPNGLALKKALDDAMQQFVIEEASITVDGLVLEAPLSGRIEATKYAYEPSPGDSALFALYGVADVPPVVDPAFVAGYWVLLRPLGSGRHEVSISLRARTGGAVPNGVKVGVAGDDVVGVIQSDEFTYHLKLD